MSCIDEEIPYDIPDTWTWMRLENCCVKEIRRGKSPKYAEISNVIVFAQKCNTKYNGIDISLAQYLDKTTIKRYPTDEHMWSNFFTSRGSENDGRYLKRFCRKTRR